MEFHEVKLERQNEDPLHGSVCPLEKLKESLYSVGHIYIIL